MATFYRGDCLDCFKRIADKSIDFVYFNPPFGITMQPWDEALDWKKIFAECFRVLKPHGTLAIHCSVPFNYTLIRDAPRAPNYSWYWNKIATTTPLLAKHQPLRHVEEILVWKSEFTKYNPQRVGDEVRRVHADGRTNYVDYGSLKPRGKKEVIGKYQTHYIEMKKKVRGFATRPDEIIELFLKSYTNEGDVVLDPTCYLGLSGVVAKRMGRKWIGFDKYFMPSYLISSTAK
jgi:site-specific DNA-methyltransferase (adenine-specific)